MRQGFSLVELSIVLVILGLLTGGILTGQNLIRAAELRSVTTEFNNYQTATHTFRDKYFYLPGDMPNATDFWGTTAANGNGDGKVGFGSGAGAAGELFGYWEQLALAGLIEGSYDGLAGSGGVADAVNGVNVPRGKLGNSGWTFTYVANVDDTSTVYYAGRYDNTYMFGATTTGAANSQGIVSPEEAWNIDTKIDDGKPALGKVVMYEVLAKSDGTGCTNPAAGTATPDAVSYKLANQSKSCAVFFRGN